VKHLDYGRVTVGEHAGDEPAGVTAAVAALVDDLAGAGIAARALDDLVLGRWKKLVWNIPYNGLSVALDAGTDELMADPATRVLVEALMWEVVEGAAACDRTIDGSFVAQMLADTEKMTPYATSMKLDFDGGRPLELDAIYGAPLAAARAGGFEMTRVQMLHDQLRFLDSRRGRVAHG
jgi:2-dehydropantoate 2-reductase